MERGRVPWGLLCALLAAAHALSFLGSGPIDDEFIVYRYADHLAQGLGPVFNAGERAEGFTVPLWMLVHAATAALAIDPVLTTLVLGILGSAVAAGAIARAERRLRPDAFPIAALAFAASPAVAWHAIAGLGTTWMAAFCALWLASWLEAVDADRSPRSAAVWIGMGALLRPELGIAALIFVVLERRPRLALLALGPLAAWVAFRLAYYGAWTPISFGVKRLALLDDLRFGGAYLWKATLELAWIPLLLAAAVALRAGERERALRGALAALGLASAFVVAVGGDFVPLARFFVPLLPLALVGAVVGLHRRLPGRAATIGCVVLIAWFQVGQGQRARLFEDHRGLTERWIAIGEQLGATLPADAAIATSPVGAIGYLSKRPIVDLLGRTNRDWLDVEPDLSISMKGHHRHDAARALALRPAALVLGNGLLFETPAGRPELVLSAWERDFLDEPGFGADYRPVQLEVEGSYPLIFYWRRDLDLPVGCIPVGS